MTLPAAFRTEQLPAAGLSRLSDLARQQREAELRVQQAEKELEAAAAALQQLRLQDVPEAMSELGISSLRLDDGSTIELHSAYHASIPSDQQDAAFSWLQQHEFGDLIKNEVKLSFGKGEDAAATKLCTSLADAGYAPEQRRAVHPSTLKAWVREQAAAGRLPPAELFGCYLHVESRLKLPK